MTSHGTPYDHLTMEELNDAIASGEISTLDLPNELLSAWAAWEPEPVDLSLFALSNAEHRQEFLYQYCAQGEPARFAAVSHIWNSLAEPREPRCNLIGIASGAGGTGKLALVNMLDKLLDEGVGAIPPLPSQDEFDSMEARHQAVMASFEEGERRLRAVCATYAAILDGAAMAPQPRTGGRLIVGPWPSQEGPG